MPSSTQLTAELAKVNELILDLLGRRAVKGAWNGREYTLHNVRDLMALRDSLEAQLAQGGTGRQVRTIVPRG